MTTRRYQAKTHKLKHLRYKRAEPAAGDWETRGVQKHLLGSKQQLAITFAVGYAGVTSTRCWPACPELQASLQ